MSGVFKRAYEIFGLGKVAGNSHPIHPATVHFPIAFLAGANILNLLYGVAIFMPAFFPFDMDKENMGTITIMGYFLNVIGILSSIPAILTGFSELYAMISTKGLYIEDKNIRVKSLNPVVKTTLIHAGLNDVAIFAAIYNWLMARNRPYEDYRPYAHQTLLSAGSLITALYAAFLGGGLVYMHGVGVRRMGAGARERKERTTELIEKAE